MLRTSQGFLRFEQNTNNLENTFYTVDKCSFKTTSRQQKGLPLKIEGILMESEGEQWR